MMKPFSSRYRFTVIVLLALAASLFACSGPDDKKMAAFEKGKAYFEEGRYAEARLELKSALQIDPAFTDAHYWLGKVELDSGNPKAAFESFSKAAEITPDHVDAQIEAGKLLLRANHPQDAITRAEAALSKAPDNADAMKLKAGAQTALGNFDEAAATLRLLVEKSPSQQAYLNLGAVLIRANRADEGEEALQQGVAAFPESVPLHIGLAEFYSTAGRLPESIELMKKVAALEPDEKNHQVTLATLLWRAGKKDEALAGLNALKEKAPLEESTWLGISSFFVKFNDFEQAESTLREGISNLPQTFELRFRLSELMMRKRAFEEAVAILEHCLTLKQDEKDPEIVRTRTILAKYYLQTGEIDRSEQYMKEAIAADGENVDALFVKGNLALVRGHYDEAVSALQRVIEKEPRFVPGYLRLGEAHARKGDLALAEVALWKGLKTAPRSKELLKALATVFVKKEDYPSAEAQYNRILEEFPDDLVSRAELGDLILAAGAPGRAEDTYKQVVTMAPNLPLGYLRLSRFYTRMQKPDKAEAELKKAYEQTTNNSPVLSELARFYAGINKPEKAAALCSERLKKNPDDPFTHDLLGQILMLQKKYDKAREHYEKAIELAPRWAEPQNNLARLFVVQKKIDEAIAHFNDTLSKDPGNALANFSIGLLYEQSGDIEKARAAYEKTLDLNPAHWLAANNLAYLISNTSKSLPDLNHALDLAKKALVFRPNDPGIQDTIGWVHYKLGEYEKARGYLESAFTASPEHPEFNFHLGMTLYRLNLLPEATEKLKTAVKSETDFNGKDTAQKTLDEIS